MGDLPFFHTHLRRMFALWTFPSQPFTLTLTYTLFNLESLHQGRLARRQTPQEKRTVTKKEIVKQISDRIGLTQLKTKEIVQQTFDAIVDTLLEAGRIEERIHDGVEGLLHDFFGLQLREANAVGYLLDDLFFGHGPFLLRRLPAGEPTLVERFKIKERIG